MNRHFEILYNSNTQTFWFVCPEGRPVGVSGKVVEFDESDDAADRGLFGNYSVETNPDTTISSAAAAGARYVVLTATTGIVVGGTYELADLLLGREFVTVVKVAVGGVYLRHPITRAYSSGTFKSTRIQMGTNNVFNGIASNISEDNDPNPRWRGILTYLVSQKEYKRYFYADMVRALGGHTVTGEDVDVRLPGFLDALPTHYREERGRPLIDQAYQEVKTDIAQQEKEATMMRDQNVMNSLVVLKTIYLFALGREVFGGGSEEATAGALRAYEERFNALIKLHTVPMFADESDGAGTVADPVPIFRR